MSDTVPIGSLPPVGEVPQKMLAQVIRQDRFGDPRTALQVEEIDVPELRPPEVLIGVMAAGINYNTRRSHSSFSPDLRPRLVFSTSSTALAICPLSGQP